MHNGATDQAAAYSSLKFGLYPKLMQAETRTWTEPKKEAVQRFLSTWYLGTLSTTLRAYVPAFH